MKKILFWVALVIAFGATSCKKCKECKQTTYVGQATTGLTIDLGKLCGDDLTAVDGKSTTTNYNSTSILVNVACE